jgi:hypothetical protein
MLTMFILCVYFVRKKKEREIVRWYIKSWVILEMHKQQAPRAYSPNTSSNQHDRAEYPCCRSIQSPNCLYITHTFTQYI